MDALLETLDVNVPVDVAYDLWRDVERWPTFLRNVDEVEVVDATTFRWRSSAAGDHAEVVVELTEVVHDDRMAWRTVEGADHVGVVTFERLTATSSRVALQIGYEPPASRGVDPPVRSAMTVLTAYDLGTFKRVVETLAG